MVISYEWRQVKTYHIFYLNYYQMSTLDNWNAMKCVSGQFQQKDLMFLQYDFTDWINMRLMHKTEESPKQVKTTIKITRRTKYERFSQIGQQKSRNYLKYEGGSRKTVCK